MILTPTERLVRYTNFSIACQKRQEGVGAWAVPTVLSFFQWVNRLREEYLLTASEDLTPISDRLSLQLWRDVVNDTDFNRGTSIARVIQRSSNLIYEYCIPIPEKWDKEYMSSDQRYFCELVAEYEKRCRSLNVIDLWRFSSELPAHIESDRIQIPSHIELIGFTFSLTPLQQRIIDACASVGSNVEKTLVGSKKCNEVEVKTYEDLDDELLAAAEWARASLENNGSQSLAVIVPSLREEVDRVERIYRRVFDPQAFRLGKEAEPAWHVSLGKPLADWSIVHDALIFLGMSTVSLTQPQLNHLLMSPYLRGWREHSSIYEELLVFLARSAPYELGLDELREKLMGRGAEIVAQAIVSWEGARRTAPRIEWPSAWAVHFQRELNLLGFAEGRSLDSVEYQVLDRWHQLIENFGRCDAILSVPVSRSKALSMIRDHAQDIFREQNRGVPVEIMGVEEALGSEFDGLWITSLDNNTWPGPVKRDPLIPAHYQDLLPKATVKKCLDRRHVELEGLVSSSSFTFGSYIRETDGIYNECTTLLKVSNISNFVSSPLMFAPLETIEDEILVPFLDEVKVRGGTGALRDQSECSFRAFAKRRLGALDVPVPKPGIDRMLRGVYMHRALELFWREIGGHEDLIKLTKESVDKKINKAVDKVLDDATQKFKYRFKSKSKTIERFRITRLLNRWIEIEKKRDPFAVWAKESSVEVNLSGIQFEGKIDRIDKMPDGTFVLIDYKTGRASKNSWFPHSRIKEPQVPAYAVASNQPLSGVAFALLRPDDLRFDGISSDSNEIPGVKRIDGLRGFNENSWEELMTTWRNVLEELAEGFRRGVAIVDPREKKVCQTCHLTGFCRIHEQIEISSIEDEDDDIDE